MSIYLAWKAQIALFIIKKVNISAKYMDFANIFLKKLAKIFLDQFSINKHAIELENSKQ